MRYVYATYSFVAVLLCGACTSARKDTYEYINAPIQLTVSLVAANTYQLSFYSDNREGGFAGYGVFTGASSAALDTAIDDMPIDISAANVFCSAGVQTVYAQAVAVQVGPAANVSAATALCYLTDLTLLSGNYVALRARVERTKRPWSAATIATVP